MARLNHANIVRYYDSWFDHRAPDLNMQTNKTSSIPTVGDSTYSSLATVTSLA